MNRQQFMEAIEQHPELTASGFGVIHGGDVNEERAALKADQPHKCDPILYIGFDRKG
jgi:hypothetical protein